MPQEIKLILSISFFVLSLVLFIVALIIVKRRSGYFKNALENIEEASKKYYMNIELEDNNLFPFYKEVVSGIKFEFKSKGEYDSQFEIKLKKHYSFYRQRVIYIINNDLHYHKQIITKNNKEYLLIDNKIKMMEILISNDKPSHYMLKYEFKNENDKISYEVKEVDYNAK